MNEEIAMLTKGRLSLSEGEGEGDGLSKSPGENPTPHLILSPFQRARWEKASILLSQQ